MSKRALAVLVLSASMIGCESNPLGSADGRPTKPSEEAQLAAFAASNRFPTNLQATDARIAAMIDRRSGAIRVVNFTNQPLTDTRIWANGSFVHPVRTIPPNGFVTLPRSDFYDGNGFTLANQAASVTRVQVQTGDRLYNAMGPVFE